MRKRLTKGPRVPTRKGYKGAARLRVRPPAELAGEADRKKERKLAPDGKESVATKR